MLPKCRLYSAGTITKPARVHKYTGTAQLLKQTKKKKQGGVNVSADSRPY
jgi:hypothetical protein